MTKKLFEGPELDDCNEPNPPISRLPQWLQDELFFFFMDVEIKNATMEQVDEGVECLEGLSEDEIEDEILEMYGYGERHWPYTQGYYD